jgi:hypothetical protein
MSLPGRPKIEPPGAQHAGCAPGVHGRAEAIIPQRAARAAVP